MYNHPMIPKSLKYWFLVHFFIDIIVGIPLLFFPTTISSFLNIEIIQTLPLRLVGAALIGIGSTSLIKKEGNVESYKSLLILKIIWSLSAIIAVLLSLSIPTPLYMWVILLTFVIFNIVWVYYYLKF